MPCAWLAKMLTKEGSIMLAAMITAKTTTMTFVEVFICEGLTSPCAREAPRGPPGRFFDLLAMGTSLDRARARAGAPTRAWHGRAGHTYI